jgi:hypothetical protein
MKKYLAALVLLLSAGIIIVVPSTSAVASEPTPYALGFTNGVGAYPRSAPEYEARTGEAVAEGTTLYASCWLVGEWVTNPYDYSSEIWVLDTSGLYWPEIWLDTGTTGVPPGVPSCDESPATSQEATQDVWQPSCDPDSGYVEGSITTAETEQGTRISLAPTSSARSAWGAGLGWASTVEMWHAIQDCVPDLYDDVADSVWQQLECHQRYATIRKPGGDYATGDTYDLEVYANPLWFPNDLTYILSRCLNGEDEYRDPFLAPLTLFAMTG